MTQKQLALLAEMAQPRISKMERPGEESFNIDTLIRLAAAFKIGLKVEFVPFSEMLAWENNYSQDAFNPTPIEHDAGFLNPAPATRVAVRPVWGTVLEISHAVRRQDVRYAACYVRRQGNILTNTVANASLPGIELPDASGMIYVENPTPKQHGAEILATPSSPSEELVAVQPVNEWMN
jgi:transcriptional regulator with XRE-family HTH domain